MLATVTFSIRPGRVPDCRTLLRGSGRAPGEIDRRFVEIGEVNTIILLCEMADWPAVLWLKDWAANRLQDAREADFLRSVTVEIFDGTALDGIAQVPVLLLERGADDGLPAITGNSGSLSLSPHSSLDAALMAAVARRRAGFSGENALLIAEQD